MIWVIKKSRSRPGVRRVVDVASWCVRMVGQAREVMRWGGDAFLFGYTFLVLDFYNINIDH